MITIKKGYSEKFESIYNQYSQPLEREVYELLDNASDTPSYLQNDISIYAITYFEDNTGGYYTIVDIQKGGAHGDILLENGDVISLNINRQKAESILLEK